jgi:hypothetical protein
MVRPLKVESDARQLGLFGDGLALGIRPKTVTTRPNAHNLAVVAKATSTLIW